MGATVEMEHHAGERFSGAAEAVLVSFASFIDQACGLEERFDESITAVDIVVFLEFFVEVGGVEALVMLPVELEDGLDFGERRLFWAWRSHAAVKDAVVTKFLITGFPAFHGSVRDSDDVSRLNPEDFFGSGL